MIDNDRQEFIEIWNGCQYGCNDEMYMQCCSCDQCFEDCYDNAVDNESGRIAFQNIIEYGGYESEDDFWETNI